MLLFNLIYNLACGLFLLFLNSHLKDISDNLLRIIMSYIIAKKKMVILG